MWRHPPSCHWREVIGRVPDERLRIGFDNIIILTSPHGHLVAVVIVFTTKVVTLMLPSSWKSSKAASKGSGRPMGALRSCCGLRSLPGGRPGLKPHHHQHYLGWRKRSLPSSLVRYKRRRGSTPSTISPEWSSRRSSTLTWDEGGGVSQAARWDDDYHQYAYDHQHDHHQHWTHLRRRRRSLPSSKMGSKRRGRGLC